MRCSDIDARRMWELEGYGITFIVPVNDDNLFRTNFSASPCFGVSDAREVIVQKHFVSAAKAYNDGIDRARYDLIVLAHQDMIFPAQWLDQVRKAIARLSVTDPNWGVLGCSGTTCDGRFCGRVYTSGVGIVGSRPEVFIESVQTLDECVLVLRKSAGLRFDNGLPHFHLYGADICLKAAERRMNCYAISAFCIHNTQQPLVLPHEFYECCAHIRRAWRHRLPIQTTCVRITASNLHICARRVREIYLRYIRRKEIGGRREGDVTALLARFANESLKLESVDCRG